MMKKFTQLNETKNHTLRDIEVMLIPFDDLGIEYKISINKEKDGPHIGKNACMIVFNYSKFRTNNTFWIMGEDDRKRYWEFLDELITFKNRLESDDVAISFDSAHKEIGVAFLI